jgi:hypothetical protein
MSTATNRDRYRATATELGFEGHMAMAEAMSMTAFILYR